MAKAERVRVRRWKAEDIAAIVECAQAVYSDYPAHYLYDQRLYEMQLDTFPEGQFLAEVGGQIVGYATSLIVHLDDSNYWYTVD